MKSMAIIALLYVITHAIADIGRGSRIDELERQVEELNRWVAGHKSEIHDPEADTVKLYADTLRRPL